VMIAQCAVVGAVRDVPRACGACFCLLCVSVRCAVHGLLVCVVSGDTRHDADMPLCMSQSRCLAAVVCEQTATVAP
jgi:hypothetical protein